VVLLDEVEKADLEVMNLFYQVFDKGMLADGEGRNIDFKNTILILTSNLASDVITELAGGDEPIDTDSLVTAIRPILSQHFQPALLARMEIVPYVPISGDAMGEIVELKLRRFGDRLQQNHRMGFAWEPQVVDQIVQRCTEVETGARNIDYIVNRNLLPSVATKLLEEMGEERAPTALKVGIGDTGEFTLAFS
jgi:type VI secretion system protein VasG